jgi:bromodomain adjacent to zinc finger domain protein 1A
LDNRLPLHLQEAYDHLFAKPANKKRKLLTTKSADEKEAEKRARREESMLQKAKLKEERDRLRQERKMQAAVKYPLEDLDLPIYRKDPNNNWALIDMSPQAYDCPGVIPYPSGGKSPRPLPHYHSPIPPQLFDSFLSIWAFLTVFSEPLKLAAYSVDDFERALFHTSHQPKATVLVEYNACLLNVIISERKEDTANEVINGDVMEDYVESLEESDDDHNSDREEEEEESGSKKRKGSKLKSESTSNTLPRVERGWRDKEHLRISQRWDNKELRANYDRRGWETTLIGCLNDVATPDLLPDVDDLLRHLVPKMSSTAADREKQYPTLSVKQKLDILSFLIDVVNESTLIK